MAWPASEIPLAARIFSVADALDAMTTDRPYRPGLPPSRRPAGSSPRGPGRQFDPAVVAALDEHRRTMTLERIRAGIG